MYRPSCDQAGQCLCIPPSRRVISTALPPSASATCSASPDEPPATTYMIFVPSGDHRAARALVRNLRGTPPTGAGITHTPTDDGPASEASNAMLEPSGDTAIPPMSLWDWTVSGAAAVRLIGSPPARNFTQRSVFPRAFERNATHFPSGETAGAASSAGPFVSRTTRENEGASVCAGRVRIIATAIAAATAVNSMPLRNPIARSRALRGWSGAGPGAVTD